MTRRRGPTDSASLASPLSKNGVSTTLAMHASFSFARLCRSVSFSGLTATDSLPSSSAPFSLVETLPLFAYTCLQRGTNAICTLGGVHDLPGMPGPPRDELAASADTGWPLTFAMRATYSSSMMSRVRRASSSTSAAVRPSVGMGSRTGARGQPRWKDRIAGLPLTGTVPGLKTMSLRLKMWL